MKKLTREKTIDYLLQVALVLGLLAAVGIFLYFILPPAKGFLVFVMVVIIPFVIAWLVSVLTKPITEFLHRKLKMPRSLAVVSTLLAIIAVVSLLFTLIGARLWVEITRLVSRIPEFYAGAMDIFNWAKEIFESISMSAEEMARIQTWFVDVVNSIGQWLTSILGGTVGLVQSTPAFFVFIMVTCVAIFFFCRDNDKLLAGAVRLVPEGKRERMIKIYERFVGIVRGYCGAQLCLVSISTAICILAFFILGVEGAVTIGLLAGVLDILPVVGPTILILPWGIYSLISGHYFLGIGLLVLLVVLTIVRNILEPKLVGTKIGLHPLATLASIYVGLRLMGLWGLALGPILLALGVCLYRSAKMTD